MAKTVPKIHVNPPNSLPTGLNVTITDTSSIPLLIKMLSQRIQSQGKRLNDQDCSRRSTPSSGT